MQVFYSGGGFFYCAAVVYYSGGPSTVSIFFLPSIEHPRDGAGRQEDAPPPCNHLPEERHQQEGDRPLQAIYGGSRQACAGEASKFFLRGHYALTVFIRLFVAGQGARHFSGPLAQEVRRVPAPPAEECGEQCRVQGPRCRPPGDRPHPGEPRSSHAPPHLPCPRPDQSLHVLAMPH